MTLDKRIRDEKGGMILIEKPQKHLHYHLTKLANMNNLQVKKIIPP